MNWRGNIASYLIMQIMKTSLTEQQKVGDYAVSLQL